MAPRISSSLPRAGAMRRRARRTTKAHCNRTHATISLMESGLGFNPPRQVIRETDATRGDRMIRGVAWRWLRVLVPLLLFAPDPANALIQAAQDTGKGGPSLSEVGARLANPLGGIWSIFTENDLFFSNGNINTDGALAGLRVVFEPILPIPLYGTGEKQWIFVTRPKIPLLVSQPVPLGFDRFTHLGGLADAQLPLVVKPPLGAFQFGLGATFRLPTATRHVFGLHQWGVGPAVVLGYFTVPLSFGIFPSYHWGVAGSRDPTKPRESLGEILYWFNYNLPDDWTIGSGRTINYDHNVARRNRWNAPLGPQVGKTTKLGKMKINFRLGAYYSVAREDVFGQRWLLTLNVIPVIPSLVTH